MATAGGASRLPSATLVELQERIGTVIDELGGGFTTQYTAVVLTATVALS